METALLIQIAVRVVASLPEIASSVEAATAILTKFFSDIEAMIASGKTSQADLDTLVDQIKSQSTQIQSMS